MKILVVLLACVGLTSGLSCWQGGCQGAISLNNGGDLKDCYVTIMLSREVSSLSVSILVVYLLCL